MKTSTISAFRLAGQLQQDLLARSPYRTGRRFFHAQWCWALGHIGLLYQVIRWLKLRAPSAQLVLETQGAANPYFLQALSPFLSIVPKLPPDLVEEAKYNAVYFGCPDGTNSLVNFYKMIEAECKDIHLLSLGDAQHQAVEGMLGKMGLKRPYVAVQARAVALDPIRNVGVKQVRESLQPFVDQGYSVVSTGLDQHPINSDYANVLDMPNPTLASFLLSADCDQFIGSNSGAWTIAHAYQRPVQLMNDWDRAAWIYP